MLGWGPWWGSHAGNFSLGWGAPRAPRPASPLPTHRREATDEDKGLGGRLLPRAGWASPPRGADRPCPAQWEKSQLDEEFLHSVENVCGCARYECGEWGREAEG